MTIFSKVNGKATAQLIIMIEDEPQNLIKICHSNNGEHPESSFFWVEASPEEIRIIKEFCKQVNEANGKNL